MDDAPLVYCRPDECSYCIALASNLETALAELAALKERHAILQSRFDQEKAAHESLQAERIAERENGRTWHREAVRLKAENERLTEKCANIPDTWGELLERAEQAEAERDAIFHEFTDDMTNSSDEWLVTFEWLQKDFPHLAAHYSRTKEGEE
jgi:chromosome segregation ATPase